MEQLNMFTSQKPQKPVRRDFKTGDKFLMAQPEIPCRDEWTPFRLSREAMEAYKVVEQEGMIHITSVQISQSTASAVVLYNSTVPIEWAHQRLKEVMNHEA